MNIYNIFLTKKGEKTTLKVLMFGWEFPPFKSGGLGTACYGLTKGLSNLGVEIKFVIPKAPYDINGEFVELVTSEKFLTSHISEIKIPSRLVPYLNDEGFKNLQPSENSGMPNYGDNLWAEVEKYALLGGEIAKKTRFDVIHAHDWMTGKAGIKAKEATGKPLVFQIHATEFDRTGGNPNPEIYAIERECFEKADRIIAVSNLTKQIVVKHYGIAPEKIDVVYNAVNMEEGSNNEEDVRPPKLAVEDKIVLFLGRVTIQKGPGYFLEAAKKISEMDPNVKFIVAGSGDMIPRMVEKTAALGLSNKVIFSGFLRGKEVDTAFKMADVYVMPSVSEPFGITPLEAMKNGTPCIISKQSGVSEVVTHALKVDFWDIDEMVNKIMGVLNYSPLHKTLSEKGFDEIMRMSWDDSAGECIKTYKRVI